MQTILKLLTAIAAITLLTGCSAQKPLAGDRADMSPASKTLHEQALKALLGHQFIIKPTFYYLPDSKVSDKAPADCYISMQGSRATIRISPDMSRSGNLTNTILTDDSATLSQIECKKEGDTQFRLFVKGHRKFLDKELLITLFKDTNGCFILFKNYYYTPTTISIRGEIFPYQE